MDLLSVIAPTRNGRGTLVELCARLKDALTAAVVPFEIILVDDGSTDGSWSTIVELCAVHVEVRGIRLAKGFGQVPAFFAGVADARGDAIAAVEADLDILPEDLPALVRAYQEGADFVSGTRVGHRSALRRIASHRFNRSMASVSGVGLEDIGSAFLVLDRSVAVEAADHGDLRRNYMIKILFAQLAETMAQVPVRTSGSRSRSNHGFLTLATTGLESRFAYGEPLAGVLAASAAVAGVAVVGALASIFALLSGAWDWGGLAAGLFSLGALLAGLAGVVALIGNHVLRTLRYHGTPYFRVAARAGSG